MQPLCSQSKTRRAHTHTHFLSLTFTLRSIACCLVKLSLCSLRRMRIHDRVHVVGYSSRHPVSLSEYPMPTASENKLVAFAPSASAVRHNMGNLPFAAWAANLSHRIANRALSVCKLDSLSSNFLHFVCRVLHICCFNEGRVARGLPGPAIRPSAVGLMQSLYDPGADCRT